MSVSIIGWLVFGLAILLGWIWPLTVGIVRTRKGTQSTGLIIFGGVWGFIGVSLMCLVGFGFYMYSITSKAYETTPFNLTEYEGPTATLTFPYKGEAEIRAVSSHDDNNYLFYSSNGSFTVPAAVIKPSMYSITKTDEQDKIWVAKWGLYNSKEAKQIELTADQTVSLNIGPPINVRVKRKEMSNGTQRLDMEVSDSAGGKVNLSSQMPPSIEILDATGTVVWTHKLEYG